MKRRLITGWLRLCPVLGVFVEFQDGDRIDFFPIAGDPNSVIMRPLIPAQIVGTRLGSVVLEHVPN